MPIKQWDAMDEEAARIGAAVKTHVRYRPRHARRRQTALTSQKGVNNVFGGCGGKTIKEHMTCPEEQIPAV